MTYVRPYPFVGEGETLRQAVNRATFRAYAWFQSVSLEDDELHDYTVQPIPVTLDGKVTWHCLITVLVSTRRSLTSPHDIRDLAQRVQRMEDDHDRALNAPPPSPAPPPKPRGRKAKAAKEPASNGEVTEG